MGSVKRNRQRQNRQHPTFLAVVAKLDSPCVQALRDVELAARERGVDAVGPQLAATRERVDAYLKALLLSPARGNLKRSWDLLTKALEVTSRGLADGDLEVMAQGSELYTAAVDAIPDRLV